MGSSCSSLAARTPADESLRALRHAVELNDSDGFKRLALLHPSLLSVKDVSDGRTALQEAIILQRVDLVVFMLSRGLLGPAAIRSRDAEGQSALDLAAWLRATRIVHVLLMTGISVERSPGQRGWTPLHVSAFLDDIEVARLLCGALREKGRPCPASDTGDTPLHVAARRHASSVSAVILDGGCVSTSATNSQGRNALHVACYHGALAVVQLLVPLLAGALDAVDAAGMAALHYAARAGHAAVCRILVANGATVGLACGTGATSVFLAATEGHAPVVRTLLASIQSAAVLGAVLAHPVGPEQQTALHAAAARNFAGVVTALLENDRLAPHSSTQAAAEHSGVVDTVDSEGRTALHIACAGNCGEAAQELLRWGASTDAVDKRGATALALARGASATTCLVLLDSDSKTSCAPAEQSSSSEELSPPDKAPPVQVASISADASAAYFVPDATVVTSAPPPLADSTAADALPVHVARPYLD